MNDKNWRLKIGKRLEKGEPDWRIDLQAEYVLFIEELNTLAKLYDWDLWGGGVENYAVTLSQRMQNGKSISIKIVPSKQYQYYACFERTWNPNRIAPSSYTEFAGETIEDALKYVHTYLMENKYIPTRDKRLCFLGGAYDRYPLALMWEKERCAEELSESLKVSL